MIIKKYLSRYSVFVTFFSFLLLLSGCGVLLTAIIQALVGTKVGIVLVAAAITGVEAKKKTDMIVVFNTSSLEGYVPLAGATVIIDNITFTTGPDGTFRFDNIPVGIKTLRIEHSGYVSIEQDIVISETGGEQRTINDLKIIPHDEPNVPIKLILSGGEQPQANFNFEVYALDPNGVTIKPDVTWSVIDPQSINNPNASIDSNGRFHSVKKGTYFITATSTINPNLSDSVNIRVIDKLITFYGNVTDSNNGPISGAIVSADGSNPYATTDVKGYYNLQGIPVFNPLTLRAVIPNTLPIKYGINIINIDPNQDPNVPVEVNIRIDSQATPTPIIQPTANKTPTPSGNSISVNENTLISISGAMVFFPAGSVTRECEFIGTVVNNIKPDLPEDITPLGDIFLLSISDPAAYNDAKNKAQLTLPITDPLMQGYGVYHSSNGTSWDRIDSKVDGVTIKANIPGFSYFVVGGSALPLPTLTPTITPTITPTRTPTATPTETGDADIIID